MKVGKNTQLEGIHKMRDAYAEGTYQRAKQYVEQFYPITDDDAFRQSFVGYLRKQIAGEKYVTNVEQNINWHELEKLSSIYSEYHVNWDAYSYDLILETPKQVEAWKMLEKVCNVLNNSQDIALVIFDPKKDSSRVRCIVFEDGKFIPSFAEVKSLLNT